MNDVVWVILLGVGANLATGLVRVIFQQMAGESARARSRRKYEFLALRPDDYTHWLIRSLGRQVAAGTFFIAGAVWLVLGDRMPRGDAQITFGVIAVFLTVASGSALVVEVVRMNLTAFGVREVRRRYGLLTRRP